MFYLLLVSGAAFVAAGALLSAQARIVDVGNAIPRSALGLLAGFTVVRGASYWVEMADLSGSAGPAVAALHVVMLALAHALLLGFTLALVGPRARRSSVVPAIALSALFAWGVSLAALLESAHAAGRTVPPATVEVFTRWLLALPASVCGAIALLGVARSIEIESWVGSRLVRSAGLAFVVHGLADALDGMPAVLHWSWPFGATVSAPTAQLALEAVEAWSAVAITILLSEVFVFQTAQRLRREETHLRDDFIALVAHELGNPVAALELAGERLELTRRAGRAVEPRLAGDVKACAVTMRRIVTDLLDTSRIHARELDTNPSAVDLGPLLARAAEVASAHEADRPPVAVDCPDGLPPVLADAARLDQILGNLLSNASKYSAHGSPVALAVERGDAHVTIRVVNEGSGIEPGEVSRIFSRSYRAHAAACGTVRGMGLGLYVARALVEAQGGRIWVDSREHRTAFCFTLPLATVVEPAVCPTPRPSPVAAR
jgi:signal transduction histidine kinase